MNKNIDLELLEKKYVAVKVPGRRELVKVIIIKTASWIVYMKEKGRGRSMVHTTTDRGYLGNADSRFWPGDEIGDEMRKIARSYFHRQEKQKIRAWEKVYADAAGKKVLPFPWWYFRKSAPPKMRRGLSLEKPSQLDLFTHQTTIDDVNRAMSHKGPRKRDNKLFSSKKRTIIKATQEQMEEQGQTRFL